jgi:WD40 repeat protein
MNEFSPASSGDGEEGVVTVRQWLSQPNWVVDRVQSLHIFKQVLDFVDLAHGQGVMLRNIRPSCFLLSPLNKVAFIDSASTRSSSPASEPPEPQEPQCSPHEQEQEVEEEVDDGECQSSGSSSAAASEMNENEKSGDLLGDHWRFPQRQLLQMELAWYTSPEEHATGSSTFASDIYSLGVLLFELFCSFGSEVERARVMADLRNRILPPRLLSESPKEASFCLRLLYPDPNCRPNAREICNSEVLADAGDALAERQTAVQLEEKEAESEVLFEFLLRMQSQKLETARKLSHDVSRLSADIQEVERRRLALKKKRSSTTSTPTTEPKGLKKPRIDNGSDKLSSKSARFMSNFTHLEKVYFSMNWRTNSKSTTSSTSEAQPDEDWLGCFFDSLCKYARYSRFEVKATLRHGDLLNTANMVCSLSFDRDEEYFATAGVCKRIKVFECDTILNEHVDIHYPVVEMPCRSKLSSVCWNGYIKNYLASCDYEGIVQLWDAHANRVLLEYEEHEKRAWSVDFSRADPTKLASGSDDGTVKLWSINQESSIGTIKTKANVCCIQFPPDSGHLLTFGSADYKVYVYDLRSTRTPLCILGSHQKAVSYVKFMNATTLVSASTDNTLKLWDLNRANTTPHALTPCSLTYTGHTNEKNFIGLSIADGYIACGSETNAVYAYHKSLPMEMASHKFGCTDPITGREVEEDGGQFVSSVCWRERWGPC